jgi:hypothetical protein
VNYPVSYFDRTKELNDLQKYAVQETRKRVIGTLLEIPKKFRGYHSLEKSKNNKFMTFEYHFFKPGYYLVVDFIPVMCSYPTCLYVVLDGEDICYIDKKEFEKRCLKSVSVL